MLLPFQIGLYGYLYRLLSFVIEFAGLGSFLTWRFVVIVVIITLPLFVHYPISISTTIIIDCRDRNEDLLIRLLPRYVARRAVTAYQIDTMQESRRRKAGRATDLFRGIPDHLVVMTGEPPCPVGCLGKGIGGPLLIIVLFINPAVL